ncbi:hypothetical protein F4802DRAFT_177187 [Xylaria palmicola]|nr:hypothetical protein F4802DRAFT_177187 [Xylaria palmicola]
MVGSFVIRRRQRQKPARGKPTVRSGPVRRRQRRSVPGGGGGGNRPRPSAQADASLVDAVPRYTREYLRGLVTDLNARLRRFDEATSDYRETLDEIRAMQRWQLGVLLVLTLLWLATVLVIALVRPKGKPMVGGHVGQSKW